jgi:hypothetical protein
MCQQNLGAFLCFDFDLMFLKTHADDDVAVTFLEVFNTDTLYYNLILPRGSFPPTADHFFSPW